jgi:acyl-CoA synthetase (NDP forming)
MVTQVIESARREGRAWLTEIESKELLAQAGLPVVETRLARTKQEAISIAKELGFPVVLKIASPDIVHKSDAGGVKLGLKNATEVGRAYREIMDLVKQGEPQATIYGVSVQRMIRPGIEVIMGMSKDAQFGPVLMFGLGGVFVEVLKDVSFRIVPITRRDARHMIEEIKAYPVLKGYRGREPANIEALEDMLLKLSHFVEQSPQIKELDLNPIFAHRDGAVAVDARIIMEES